MRDAYIAAAVRTPVGKGKPGGALSTIHPVDLSAHVLRALLDRTGVPAADVEDVIWGCVTQTGEQGGNIARLSLLKAGFPVEVPGVSVNRMCGSSQQAVHFATQAVRAGDAEVVVAGGVESMSRVPMMSDWPRDAWPSEFPYPILHQGISAEMIAEKWGLTREELDDLGYESHLRAARATREGAFRDEIVPVQVRGEEGSHEVTVDEGIRFNPDREKMAQLQPAFKENGVITAGNASQISDGAAALLIASESALARYNLTPLARILAGVVVGSDPVLMLTGPIPATYKGLKRAGLTLEDIDLFEVNEAFASVVLAWQRETGVSLEKVNVHGGAIALGHPLGASGARIMTTLVHAMHRHGARYGLHTMCIGYGMATATVLERV